MAEPCIEDHPPNRLERQLDKLRERESRVYDEMAAAASDHERVLVLDATLRGLRDERAVMDDTLGRACAAISPPP